LLQNVLNNHGSYRIIQQPSERLCVARCFARHSRSRAHGNGEQHSSSAASASSEQHMSTTPIFPHRSTFPLPSID